MENLFICIDCKEVAKAYFEIACAPGVKRGGERREKEERFGKERKYPFLLFSISPPLLLRLPRRLILSFEMF